MLMTFNPAINGWAIFSKASFTACRVMAKRLRDVCPYRKANALARRTPRNFIVAAGVSRLKLLTGWNNERTYARAPRFGRVSTGLNERISASKSGFGFGNVLKWRKSLIIKLPRGVWTVAGDVKIEF
jgi:hypothetical protein